MRSSLRTLFLLTAALTAAVVLYASLTAPPRAVELDSKPVPTIVTGAYHIHTSRSDGTGTVDEVADAAARAGLRFIVLTDHGDGTRTPDAPAYRHGVLTIDAVELNTDAGHLVALGLDGPAPYPLAGQARDVIEDVHRLGGLAVIAHPDSPKPDLRWRAMGNTDFDGLEWINVDSEWRDERFRRLVAVGMRALIRSPEAIASMFQRPTRTLERWDAAARQRPVFGLAAVDAHARIGWRETEEPRGRTALARPSYESLFKTVVENAVLDAPLTGDAANDARAVLAALTTGRSFSTVAAYAHPATLDFAMERDGSRVPMGGRTMEAEGAVMFRADVPQAPGARLTLMQDGKPIATGQGTLAATRPATRGVYRVEVSFPGAPAPWIMSNPIVIDRDGPPAGPFPGPLPPPPADSAATIPVPPSAWRIEKDAQSNATTDASGEELGFAFGIAGGTPRGQYAAIATDLNTDSGVDAIQFTGRASAPVRVSVQLRLPGGPQGSRWGRSVYLDTTPRQVVIRLQDFDPIGPATSRRPIAVPVQGLLVVVDTLNTLPGTEGKVWLSDLKLSVAESNDAR